MKNPSHNPKLLSGLFATGLLAACLLSPQAQAGVVVTWSQSGSDVIATYTGSWDLAATTAFPPGFAPPVHSASTNDFYSLQPSYTVYDSLGLTPMTPSGATSTGASSWGGDNFAYDSFGNIGLNSGYTSGDPINGYLQFSGTTLATMFPSGSPDNLTVFNQMESKGNTIVFNTIPEASSAVMGLSGLSLLFLRRRQRQR